MKKCQIFLSLIIVFLLFSKQIVKAQSEFAISGYVSNMQSVIYQDVDSNWINDNLLHNRINMHFYGQKYLSGSLQLRNRLLWGETVKYQPGYVQQVESDAGLVDMNVNLLSGMSYILNSTIDRAWLKFTAGAFEAKLGRQRINWGRSFVWNPNDLFNNYSFFDFDYEEKPGSDALHLQYYTGASSSLEIAVKADSAKQVTGGLLYHFNWQNFDWQFMAGLVEETDWAGGFGWSGNFGSFGFRGETSYFVPKKNWQDTTGLFMISFSVDYTFTNSLYLQSEFLYADIKDSETAGFMDFYTKPLNVKNLTFTPYNLFAQASYPITPLLNASISAMYYPKIKGSYAGTGLGYSLDDNLDFSVFTQFFSGEFPETFTGEIVKQNFNLFFLRFKYNY